MMTWDQDVEKIVVENWIKGSVFVLADMYQFERELKEAHPNNNNVREKIRQTLQHLRDQGLIEFVDDDGTYRRTK
jgi:hypothetical protein